MKQPLPKERTVCPTREDRGFVCAGETQTAINAMSKTLDVIIETIRDPRHPFRKLGHQPKKALKNRYERRKIKEFLHLSDWQTEAEAV